MESWVEPKQKLIVTPYQEIWHRSLKANHGYFQRICHPWDLVLSFHRGEGRVREGWEETARVLGRERELSCSVLLTGMQLSLQCDSSLPTLSCSKSTHKALERQCFIAVNIENFFGHMVDMVGIYLFLSLGLKEKIYLLLYFPHL